MRMQAWKVILCACRNLKKLFLRKQAVLPVELLKISTTACQESQNKLGRQVLLVTVQNFKAALCVKI